MKARNRMVILISVALLASFSLFVMMDWLVVIPTDDAMKFLDSLRGKRTLTVIEAHEKYLSGNLNDSNNVTIILRNDVDRSIRKAFYLSMLEASLGIKATYYLNLNGHGSPDTAFHYLDTFSYWINNIKLMEARNNEIGYHYESYTEARGNKVLALQYFDEDISLLSRYFNVTSCSAHGAHYFMSISNEDLFKAKNGTFDLGLLSSHGVILESYHLEGKLAIDQQGFEYLRLADLYESYEEMASIVGSAPNNAVIFILMHPFTAFLFKFEDLIMMACLIAIISVMTIIIIEFFKRHSVNRKKFKLTLSCFSLYPMSCLIFLVTC